MGKFTLFYVYVDKTYGKKTFLHPFIIKKFSFKLYLESLKNADLEESDWK